MLIVVKFIGSQNMHLFDMSTSKFKIIRERIGKRHNFSFTLLTNQLSNVTYSSDHILLFFIGF